jgi:AI-2E family transporter
VIAALLAIVLGPVVDLTERRLHLRRAVATLLVFLVAVVAFAGMLTVFIRPLATEGAQLADKAPACIDQARAGRGPVGALIKRYELDQYVTRNQARLREIGSRVAFAPVDQLPEFEAGGVLVFCEHRAGIGRSPFLDACETSDDGRGNPAAATPVRADIPHPCDRGAIRSVRDSSL